MKILNSKAAMVAVGVVAAGAVVYFLSRRAADAASQAAGAVGRAINPANPSNLVNRGISGAGQAITGDSGFSLGSWIYDLVNDPYDPNAPTDASLDYIEFSDLPRKRGVVTADTIAAR